MTASEVVVLVVTFAGSQVMWGLIAWVKNRKGEKAKAAREQKADEDAEDKAKRDRKILLAESQAIAQDTALKSANTAVAGLERRCDKCFAELKETREELHGLRDITGTLIDVLEALMDEDTPVTRADARATIRLARRAM